MAAFGFRLENIEPTMEVGLSQKLNNAEQKIELEEYCEAIGVLTAFQNQVNAQKGKKISEEAAEEMIAYADSIIAWLMTQLPPGESCTP